MSQPIYRKAHEGTWISWLGSPAQFLMLGSETDGHYCISKAISPIGGGAPPHAHDFEEGFYVLKGSQTFIAGNQRHTLSAGDFINIQSGVAHAVENESGAEVEVLIICGPSGFDRFQMEGGYPLKGPDSTLTPFDDVGRARLKKAAEKYGIDMNPPKSAFQVEPRVTITRKSEGVLVDAVGDRYRFLASRENTNGKYAIWEATLGPGGGPPPHIHRREEEGFYLLEGEITFHTAETSFTAKAGEFVHLPRNGLHWFKNETDLPARTLILVAPGGLEKMFLETGVTPDSADHPLTPPSQEEKDRLIKIAPDYGVELRIPH